METNEFLAALDRDSAAFVDACAVAGLGVPVPSCPDWTVADLLWHLTEVHDFWRTIVAEHRTTWEGYERTARARRRGSCRRCTGAAVTDLLQTTLARRIRRRRCGRGRATRRPDS